MAIQPIALGVEQPQINGVAAFQAGEANALNAKSERMKQEAASLQQLAEIGYGVLDHNLDGPINQERLGQVLDLLGENPIAARIKANPELIRTITKGSLDVLANTQDVAKFEEAKRQFEANLNNDTRRLDLTERGLNQDLVPKPTDDQREFAVAKEQGFEGNFMDYMKAMKGAAATQIVMPGETQGGASVAQFQKDYGGLMAKKYGEITSAADAAQSNLGTLKVMENAITAPGFYSGMGAEQLLQLKRAASAIGLDPEGVDSMESFNSLNKQSALQAMGGSLGAGFSNADRDFVTEQVPSLANTPEGNKKILGIQREIAKRKIEIGKMATKYVRKNGVLDAGFEEELAAYAEQNPIFADMGKDTPSGDGGSVDDLVNKWLTK